MLCMNNRCNIFCLTQLPKVFSKIVQSWLRFLILFFLFISFFHSCSLSFSFFNNIFLSLCLSIFFRFLFSLIFFAWFFFSLSFFLSVFIYFSLSLFLSFTVFLSFLDYLSLSLSFFRYFIFSLCPFYS